MPATATLTIRITPDLKEKLGRLALETRRSKAFLAKEAVESYVARELEIVDEIERGLADVAAGRVVPHEVVVAELQAVIGAAPDRRR